MTAFHLYLYGPNCGSIETTFEAAAGRLQKLTNLYFEPDGSFVWSRKDAGTATVNQVYGMLYDAADQLQYVELRGDCDRAMWREIVGAVLGDAMHDLAVMSLPERQLQDLQRFEESTFC